MESCASNKIVTVLWQPVVDILFWGLGTQTRPLKPPGRLLASKVCRSSFEEHQWPWSFTLKLYQGLTSNCQIVFQFLTLLFSSLPLSLSHVHLFYITFSFPCFPSISLSRLEVHPLSPAFISPYISLSMLTFFSSPPSFSVFFYFACSAKHLFAGRLLPLPL